jgi:hypothetical protein
MESIHSLYRYGGGGGDVGNVHGIYHPPVCKFLNMNNHLLLLLLLLVHSSSYDQKSMIERNIQWYIKRIEPKALIMTIFLVVEKKSVNYNNITEIGSIFWLTIIIRRR